MTIALTGATGFVGQAVLDEAARRGLPVRALTRRPQEARSGMEWIGGDLHDPGALRDLAQGAKAIVHVAGVVNAPDAGSFHRGNVEGTANLIASADAAGVDRLVHVSSLAARAPELSQYGRSKRQAEQLVEATGLDWTIVRPPAVYGPRDTEMFELFRAARWGIVPMPPAGRASVLHVEDLARLLLDLAAPVQEASRRVFEPDDGTPAGWSHRELAHAIGSALGRRVWAPPLPAGLLAGAARLDGLVRGSRAKLTPDRARYMGHPDWVCAAEQAVPPSLWTPRIDTREGLRRTAAWYREAGWL